MNRNELNKEIKEAFGLVPQWMNEVPDAALSGVWGQLMDFHMAETEIPNKYKDLIGIAVSGATRCRYCTLFHTESARLHGATDIEIAEASMCAGVTMGLSTFINAQQIDYEDYAKETRKIVDYVRKHQGESRVRRASK